MKQQNAYKETLERQRQDAENELAEYALTIIAADGSILSQQTGLSLKDKYSLPPFVGPGGRYFHRTDRDIRPLLAAASKVKRKVLKKSLYVYGCTEAQREKLLQAFAVDPQVTYETIED
jgi:hypothetical protein